MKMMRSFMAQKVRMERMMSNSQTCDNFANPLHVHKYYGVTLLHVPKLTVISIKKYNDRTAVQVGWNVCKPEKLSKPQRAELEKLNLPFLRKRCEIQWLESELPAIGTELTFDNAFTVGEKVSVSGETIGHGFSGVMKRWNFAGQRATHGNSLKHRAGGSTGARNRNSTWKGQKMAGHYGVENVTVHGIKIVDFDKENSILALSGSIPGKANWVRLSHRMV